MQSVGQIEKKTQVRVVALFRERLSCKKGMMQELVSLSATPDRQKA